MGRRRQEKTFDLLVMAPWWVSAVLGVIVYVGLRWGLPATAGENQLAKGLVQGMSSMAIYFAGFLWVVSVFSAIFGMQRRRSVDRQNSLESLQSMTWKEFEFMVAEAYRRQGYRVEFSMGGGADGGVDLVLHKDGRKSFVQCKRWRKKPVTVEIVREQFGILTAEKADEAIIVTTGSFTDKAIAFAHGQPMRLIDGPQLLELVQSVQSTPSPEKEEPAPSAPVAAPTPDCPKCGRPMVERVARQGPNAGRPFWGCPGYPKCRGTRPMEMVA